jgi:broad specificity phosphatase PhoE
VSKSPTHVRFVRHGEVAEKHRGTFYGGAEADLSEHGHAESLRLAATLAVDVPDRVLTSPLTRARILAEELARLAGRQAEIVHAFRELDRGDWTHKQRTDIEQDSPGAIERYMADPEGAAAPGGETEDELCDRVYSALDLAVAHAPGGRLVVVSHAHVIRVVMRRLLDWSATESLHRFVPYHAVVEMELWSDGTGQLVGEVTGELPEALRG